jgi:hypothetical protein
MAKLGLSVPWLDFAAEHDPFAGSPPLGSVSVRVRNEQSLSADHWAYWRNTEEFVLPLITALVRAEACPVQLSRPGDQQFLAGAQMRRQRRAAILAIARAALLSLAAARILLLSASNVRSLLDRARHPFGVLQLACSRLCGPVAPPLASSADVILAGSLLGTVLLTQRAWRRWDRKARMRVLARQLPVTISCVSAVAGASAMIASAVLPVVVRLRAAVVVALGRTLMLGAGLIGIMARPRRH